MSATDLLADLLIVLGLLLTTLGVVGIYRMPDVYTQLHASGKAAFLGTLAFLAAAAVAGNGAVDAKAVLIALFLVLTAPVAAHVIARASYERGEQMATPGAVDETRPRPHLVSGEMSATAPKLPEGIEACLFDLDGVLTETAKVHAKAWKRMFDAYLAERSERGEGGELREFDPGEDYNEYVDGKPRYDGVRSFLDSRGIELPEGDPGDPPGRETVCGLGNRKNELVMEILRHDRVEAYPGSVRFVEAARDAGLRRAVVSSSANCREVLRAAGIEGLFEELIDGRVAAEQELAGKPAPDTYLAAARALGVEPGAAAVFEDAVSGVEAGSAGGFGYVVGVDRVDHAGALREHGASVVVRDLAELLSESP